MAASLYLPLASNRLPLSRYFSLRTLGSRLQPAVKTRARVIVRAAEIRSEVRLNCFDIGRSSSLSLSNRCFQAADCRRTGITNLLKAYWLNWGHRLATER